MVDNSNMSELYKRAYFHAVRRAMLENETVMKLFMETVATGYSDSSLKKLDKILITIYDNELFDLIMGNVDPESFEGRYDVAMLRSIAETAKCLRR